MGIPPLEWLTFGLLVVTAFYAWQTRQTVREMHADRVGRFVPYLEWQDPSGALAVHLDGWARRSLLVVVRNVGPGNARITEAHAHTKHLDGSPKAMQVHRLAVPSILSTSEMITLLIWDDVALKNVLDPAADSAWLQLWQPMPVTIRVRYEDIVGDYDYETAVVIELQLDQAAKAGVTDIPTEPRGPMLTGHPAPATWHTHDARSPRQRRRKTR